MIENTDSRTSRIRVASPPAPNFLRDFMAVLLLWALVIVFFWRIALAGRVLADGDVFTYFYPYWAEATRAMQAGRLPLWNPYLFMGAPFLANSQVGVFYPLNRLLWLLLPAHQSIHLTIVLHLCLAALNGYLWGRSRSSLRLGRTGAWTVGAIFALGGYLGAQVEHVNQLQGLAWLPLMLTLCDWLCGPNPQAAFASLAAVVGLVFLAGHTQTAFISLVGLAVYGLGPPLWCGLRHREWRSLIRRAAILAGVVGLGGALAAVQLIPTWELSHLSVRAGGLPFNERVSFSLAPLYLARALLPGFTAPVSPEHIEHVAYVGIAGLAFAMVGLCTRRSNQPSNLPIYFLITLGLFLSLGFYNPLYLLLARFAPGFAHFRVPARWMALYALGVAALAGWGGDALFHRRKRVGWRDLGFFALVLVVLVGWAVMGVQVSDGVSVGGTTVVGWIAGIVLVLGLLLVTRRVPRLAATGLLVSLVVELFAASSALPHSRATAPQAFTSLRPAIAHLLAVEGEDGEPPARFISMSDITFDPGDLPEIEVIYGPQLSADTLYSYVIATKHKEVLSPNLPLAFGIPAVDGYGGGVLPLAHYVTLQRLLLPDEEQVSIDGRLRENLTTIPDDRWLNLFNVRHVITDKLHDAWLDDVFYDLQFGAQLGRGEKATVAHVPEFEATALGLVSYLRGATELPDGAVAGVVEVGFGAGVTRTFELRAGEQTAEGLYDSDVVHVQAPVGGHFWPGQPEGNDYVTRLRWQEPSAPVAVLVRATLPEGELVVRGVSLIDERTGGFQALVLSDEGRFRLAHSGDVKVYENLGALGRAFLVHKAVVAADDGAALALMRDTAFDPAQVVLLESSSMPQPLRGAGRARVTHYAPERVEVEVDTESPGYLVLTDAWYPGWEAAVDGEPVPVQRANLLFRAVAVDAGQHHVVFTFRPLSLLIGAGVSLAGMGVLLVVVALTFWHYSGQALRCPKQGAML
ncbi:MAG: YfhO family protein [Chloroflexota bacterium]|nr:YfhO family protein [Chloroflexota bacterium]